MKPEELAVLADNEKAFRMWTIEHVLVLEKDWSTLTRFFSVSVMMNIVLALGAVLEVLRTWK